VISTTCASGLGKNPRTEDWHLPDARFSRTAHLRGAPRYQVDDLLVDYDLFKRLHARGVTRGPDGIDDLELALGLVTGTPFTEITPKPGGGSTRRIGSTSLHRAPWSTSPKSSAPTPSRPATSASRAADIAHHAALTVATDLPVYFAHPRSPWERPTNENTNGLVREYLPKGTEITSHQPYLDAIADELNDRPRASLGYLTPREVFEKLLVQEAVA
jgi:hypothetical protein